MKVLVVHPAQQHSYRLAAALSKKGWLDKYITTVYYKKHSLTHFASLFLDARFQKKAQARKCTALADKDVLQFCEIEGLLKLLAMNTAKLRPYYKRIKYHTADRFAKKVARYAIQHNVDAVASYDDCSSLLFELLEQQAPQIIRVMDISAANILYMRNIYERDTVLQPTFATQLLQEREIVWNPDNIERAKQEIQHTQVFLAPSQFVARSLKYSGVMDKQIKICPYGVDTTLFAQKRYRPSEEMRHTPIRFIYVGGAKELKGIGYLLEAFSEIPRFQAGLTVVGQYNAHSDALRPYLERVDFTGSLLHTEVADHLKNADVFIFPSLGEGLSLATLEAASCGLPLIVSENAGVNDAMTDGKEGFVVPIQSKEALVQKIKWFIQNPDQIEPMGKAAREMALRYTWDTYYQRIDAIFDEIGQVKEQLNG